MYELRGVEVEGLQADLSRHSDQLLCLCSRPNGGGKKRGHGDPCWAARPVYCLPANVRLPPEVKRGPLHVGTNETTLIYKHRNHQISTHNCFYPAGHWLNAINHKITGLRVWVYFYLYQTVRQTQSLVKYNSFTHSFIWKVEAKNKHLD